MGNPVYDCNISYIKVKAKASNAKMVVIIKYANQIGAKINISLELVHGQKINGLVKNVKFRQFFEVGTTGFLTCG